jgi:mono/diheme cytochrome c family protein
MLQRVILMAALIASVVTQAAAEDVVARGKYLAVLGDCEGCHTKSTAGAPPFAGGLPFVAAFGTMYSSNITPDKQTGIGRWTQDQFYRALHTGVAAHGKRLYPAFPFIYFTHVTRPDSDAVLAYLRTVKPVRARPPANRLTPPFNIRAMMAFWDAMFFREGAFKNDPSKSAAWNRGNYIVNGFGHCAECHTPKNILFGDENDQALAGAVEEGWFSANLNGNRRDGLGRWTAADIVQYLKTGRNRYAWAAGSMQEKVASSTSKMNDGDLMAIATYLKSLPAAPQAQPKAPDASAMRNGQSVFVSDCSSCHSEPGAGTPRDYPSLAGDTLVVGHSPETVTRIVLEGAQSARTANAPTAFSMPGFGALTDKDVADVVTYIRNSWGNRAAPIYANDVKVLRKLIAAEGN